MLVSMMQDQRLSPACAGGDVYLLGHHKNSPCPPFQGLHTHPRSVPPVRGGKGGPRQGKCRGGVRHLPVCPVGPLESCSASDSPLQLFYSLRVVLGSCPLAWGCAPLGLHVCTNGAPGSPHPWPAEFSLCCFWAASSRAVPIPPSPPTCADLVPCVHRSTPS